MGSSEIKVTFSALATAQSDIVSTTARINSQLADLKQFLAPMAATWHGASAEAYQVQQRKWDAAAEDLTIVLGKVGAAVGAGNEAYQHAENTVAKSWAV